MVWIGGVVFGIGVASPVGSSETREGTIAFGSNISKGVVSFSWFIFRILY